MNDTSFTTVYDEIIPALQAIALEPGPDLYDAVASVLEIIPAEDRFAVFQELDERPGQFPGYSDGGPEWHWKLRRTRNSSDDATFGRLVGRS